MTGESSRARRKLATKRLRWAAVAAAVALFITTWRATQQANASGASNNGSGNTNGSFEGQQHDDDGGGFQGDNGSSGVNTQPGNSIPSTGSGVS